MNPGDRQHLDWIDSRQEELRLTELERLMLELSCLTRNIYCNKNQYQGLQFKSDRSYLTNDGYRLGSLVWMMWCTVDGEIIPVFGGTPEETVRNAIALFTGYLEHRGDKKAWYKFLDEFQEGLKAKAGQYGRYV